VRLVPVNQAEIDALFERIEKAIDTMGDVVVHKSMDFAVQTVSEIFEGEGAHPGLGTQEWQSLSEMQKGIRAHELGEQWAEHPILQFYGDLYFSLTEPDHPNAMQAIMKERPGDYEGLYGTSDPKFELHQKGTEGPKRVIWPVDAAEERLMAMMEGHLLHEVERIDGV